MTTMITMILASFTENSGFRRPRTVIRGTVAYSQSHNIQTFRDRQGVDNQI